MAIQMRRGNSAYYDPSKLVAGEFAVSQDNQRVYLCVSQGNVVEIMTNAPISEWTEEAEAWAVGERDGEPVPSTDETYHNNSKYYAEICESDATSADTSALDSEAWAVGTRNSVPVTSGDATYHNNSKYYAEQGETYYEYLQTAVEPRMPEFTINWSTGELEYTGGYFTFWIDENGFIHWGVEVESEG